jgi:hypothetical protein
LSFTDIDRERLIGNIALVSHLDTIEIPGSFWFSKEYIYNSRQKRVIYRKEMD